MEVLILILYLSFRALSLQLDKLDLGGVALAMGLLKLPRMPELKGVAVRGFAPDHVDVHSLQYKDKVRSKI